MRAPTLIWLVMLTWCPVTSGCGETFVATEGTGGTGDGGDGTGNRGGGTGASGGAGGTQTTGSEGGGGGAGGGPLCTVESSNECVQCLLVECESTLCTCLDSEDCVDLGECVVAAGKDPPPAKIELCWQYFKKGISLAGSLQACGSQSCPACNYDPVTPCTACQYKQCSEQIDECLGAFACTSYIGCLAACPENDDECLVACSNENSAGQQLFQKLSICAKAECEGDC